MHDAGDERPLCTPSHRLPLEQVDRQIVGKDGERVFVRLERRSNASITVMGTSAAIGGAGVVAIFAELLPPAAEHRRGPREDCRGSQSCGRRKADVERRSDTAATVSKAGLVMLVTGAVGLAIGGLVEQDRGYRSPAPSASEGVENGGPDASPSGRRQSYRSLRCMPHSSTFAFERILDVRENATVPAALGSIRSSSFRRWLTTGFVLGSLALGVSGCERRGRLRT